MKTFALGLISIAAAACAGLVSVDSEPVARLPALDDFGPAPEIANRVWLNSPPLRLADLRGRVVLLEFWTFGCVNCRNVIPALRAWHDRYAAQGLVIVANHFPEFAYEADLEALQEAVARLGVVYAVAQDNTGETWRAYRVRAWPTLALIDKHGHIRYWHVGEGRYAEIDAAIRALLAEPSP